MKQKYISPETEVCYINNELIVCTSPTLNPESSDTNDWNLSKYINSDVDTYEEEEF